MRAFFAFVAITCPADCAVAQSRLSSGKTAPGAVDSRASEPARTGDGLITLVKVDIRVDGATQALGPLRFSHKSDGIGGVHVDADRGDIVDAAWITRQFAANGMIGAPVTVDQITGLVQRVNQLVASEGYINSGILMEPQDFSPANQTLRLHLVLGQLTGSDEGRLPAITWKNGRHGGLTDGYIRARLSAIDRVPFNATLLERQFRLLAEDPAIATLNADLRAGRQAGKASLALSVDPADRFDLYAVVANSRSPSVGGVRYAMGGSARNLPIPGAVLSGELGKTKGLDDGTLSLETPFVGPRLRLTLRGSYNQASVIDAPLRPLDIRSKDWSSEGELSFRWFERPLLPAVAPAQPRTARTVSTSLLVSHRESRTSLLGEPFSFSPGANNGLAQYTALRVGSNWVERSINQVFVASLVGTLGLDGSRSDVPGVPSPHRNFKIAQLQLNYAHRLTRNNLELRARVLGQVTAGVVYSLERLAVGGQDTVRGYRENVLLADSGAIGSIELAQPFSLSRGKEQRSSFAAGAFTVSAFVDGAAVRNHVNPQPDRKWLGSAGVSLAWTPTPAIFARVTYGIALRSVSSANTHDLQDNGMHFQFVVHPLTLFRR